MKLPKDTEIWAISNETPGLSLAFKKTTREKGQPIPFPLLSDNDRKITNIFGLLDPRYIGSGKEGIPYASTYIINKNGIVAFANILINYRTRPSIIKLLSVLKDL